MKILIDSAIPFINGVIEPYGEIIYKKGSDISAEDVKNCDGLIIRTRTHCNEALLKGSCVRFIGTATIGYDHIDLQYCKQNSIKVATAAGCNAMGVVQYVMAALLELEKIKPIETIGIVGVGNVGGALQKLLLKLGYKVLVNDPPRAEKENDFNNTPLDILLKNSDLITLHTPLDHTTIKLASQKFFQQMGKEKFFINASRGEVVDEEALLGAIKNEIVLNPIIDVWCNEPNINSELCKKVFVATPHIAGYSQQGKANGTAMMVAAMADFFQIEQLKGWYPEMCQPAPMVENISRDFIRENMPRHYNLFSDSNSLKNNINSFEELRNTYKYRKEFF